MKFKVLGCSGSELDRNHPCSFMIDDRILIDMGSAASRLTLEEQSKITDIFVSHAHLDHTKDIPFFAENVFDLLKHTVTIRSTSDTIEKLRKHILNNAVWPDFTKLPSEQRSILKYEPFRVGEKVKVAGMELFTVAVNHPGGCVAMFFKSKEHSVLYTGDTGPTEEVWREVNRREGELKAIILETSFPNRLQKVAEDSGHLTPSTMKAELEKIRLKNVPVLIYHMKAPYRDEILKEIRMIQDERIQILEPGMTIEF